MLLQHPLKELFPTQEPLYHIHFLGKKIYTMNEKLNHFGKKGMVIAYSCVMGFLLNRWIYYRGNLIYILISRFFHFIAQRSLKAFSLFYLAPIICLSTSSRHGCASFISIFFLFYLTNGWLWAFIFFPPFIKSQPNILLVFIKFNIRQNITKKLCKNIPKEVRIQLGLGYKTTTRL
jgi:hypothetical protein